MRADVCTATYVSLCGESTARVKEQFWEPSTAANWVSGDGSTYEIVSWVLSVGVKERVPSPDECESVSAMRQLPSAWWRWHMGEWALKAERPCFAPTLEEKHYFGKNALLILPRCTAPRGGLETLRIVNYNKLTVDYV